MDRDSKGLIAIVLILVAAIAIPVLLVFKSDYADTTSVLKVVTVTDKNKELKTGDYTYYIYTLTLSDGEQTAKTMVDAAVYNGVEIGMKIYATVHYKNSDESIAKVVILNETEYKREMERLEKGYISIQQK